MGTIYGISWEPPRQGFAWGLDCHFWCQCNISKLNLVYKMQVVITYISYFFLLLFARTLFFSINIFLKKIKVQRICTLHMCICTKSMQRSKWRHISAGKTFGVNWLIGAVRQPLRDFKWPHLNIQLIPEV